MLDAILRTYIELGTTAMQSGRYDVAESFFNQAIKELQEEGEKDASLAPLLVEIAQVYASAGQFKKAEAYYQRAYLIYKNVLGVASRQCCDLLDLLAELSIKKGMYLRAAQFYKRALLYEERDGRGESERFCERQKKIEYIYDSFGR
jgi:tetratricopeptide (TPR) repeat protein